MCFEFLHIFCLKYFSFKEEMSAIWPYSYIGLHVKYLLFMSDFNEILDFLDRFPRTTHISNFIQICPVGAELSQSDGQTDRKADMTKLIVAFAILWTCLKIIVFFWENWCWVQTMIVPVTEPLCGSRDRFRVIHWLMWFRLTELWIILLGLWQSTLGETYCVCVSHSRDNALWCRVLYTESSN